MINFHGKLIEISIINEEEILAKLAERLNKLQLVMYLKYLPQIDKYLQQTDLK